MAGRYALIAAPTALEASALQEILADPSRGDFTVTRARDAEGIVRFLAARDPDDVVLVHSDGVLVDAAALAACRSAHVLVLAADRDAAKLDAPPGGAVVTGAPTSAVVRALRGGRADRDADGEVTALELYERIGHTVELLLDGELDASFVVTRTQRQLLGTTRADRARRLRRQRRILVALGTLALLAGLPLPWVYGATGLEYAFGEGTAWPSRVAVLTVLVVALGAAVHLWRGRGAAGVLVLVAGMYGALLAFLSRWDDPDLGYGFVLTILAPLLIVAGTFKPALEHRDAIGFAAAGGFLVALQVVRTEWWSFSLFLGFVLVGVAGRRLWVR